ncbi:MAG: hypothetical protein ACI8Q1_003266 [Parvicella sp.]|jgi:hypothetical protein
MYLIPSGLGFILGVLGLIPVFKLCFGSNKKEISSAKELAFVVVPFVVGAIGMMSVMTHMLVPEA